MGRITNWAAITARGGLSGDDEQGIITQSFRTHQPMPRFGIRSQIPHPKVDEDVESS